MSRTSWCGAVSHGLCPVGYTANRASICRANRSCSYIDDIPYSARAGVPLRLAM